MMIYNDQSVEINHNPNRLFITDHPYRILAIRGSGSRKISVIMYLNQSIQQLHQTYKNLWENVQVGLLIQS